MPGKEPKKRNGPEANGNGASPWRLTIAAIGIVYGDIGTSPLYAIKESFARHAKHAVAIDQANVLGVLSLFFWSLVFVITVKYIGFLLRADNKGEGGILSLVALLPGLRGRGPSDPRIPAVVLMACFGAALLLGDGMITPAISVLSAVEGLREAGEMSQGVVVLLTCGILIALFSVQSRGTGRVGALFGPVVIVWFVAIASLGVHAIAGHPAVLRAVWPGHAVHYFARNGLHGATVLGSVVLCVTGGEALYADMGHFGRGPIQRAWLLLVLPALLASYFGQGAYLLSPGPHAENTFFGIVPHLLRYPMVLLATLATVIASQALISGSYSLTRQAVQLGLMPRVTIKHTSGETEGQIYIPEVNWILMVACVGLVLGFWKSGNLAAAYGIAVTGNMALTSLLYFRVIRERFGWGLPISVLLVGSFLLSDLAFFGANATKLFEGGFVPILIATSIAVVMTTWRRGRAYLAGWVISRTGSVEELLARIRQEKTTRVSGTAVFMTSNPNGVPPVLFHHWEHNQVLHEKIVMLSIVSLGVPTVPTRDRLSLVEVGEGIFQVEGHYGYMQTPHVPHLLRLAASRGLKTDPATTTYFLGRESLLTSGRVRMPRWRKTLFAFVSRNARPATAYFGIPPDRVVELGIQIEL